MAKWMPRAVAVAVALLVAMTVAQCALAPTGFGTSCDVYRVRGRLVDAATGQPIAGMWVCPRPEAPGTRPDASAWAPVVQEIAASDDAQRAYEALPPSQRPAPHPDGEALGFRFGEVARTGPDGSFEAWIVVRGCDAVGGLFPDPPRASTPPPLRSLWVARAERLVATVPIAGSWRRTSTPERLRDPTESMDLGDVRVTLTAPDADGAAAPASPAAGPR
ncbi:MAG: hypothetical protein JNM10_14815 [Planctomycetia bacterium]|nr:hypothetical protein [Planctomycetia bacterium]